MDLKTSYERAKAKLLEDRGICRKNRTLFSRFFKYEEYKLKRINSLASIDDNSHKTLLSYTTRLRVVNRWFKNKAWVELTKADIKKVYDDLEDGKIVTSKGVPLRDKRTYYNKIIRGKPFEMAGKSALVKEVMEFVMPHEKEEVRFIKEDAFRRLVDVISSVEQRAFLWLCWDIGENASAIVKLRPQDCHRQINPHTKEPEYLINLPKEILKRSRRPRSELTNYKETVQYMDLIIQKKADNTSLFDFREGWGKKFLQRAALKSGVKCLPGGQPVTLKDLRSSMACDLLAKDWSRDQVNARLGHAPSSRQIDRYINFLAIDRGTPKQKFNEGKLTALQRDLEVMKEGTTQLSRELQDHRRISTSTIKQIASLLKVHSHISELLIRNKLGTLKDSRLRRSLERWQAELVQNERAFDKVTSVT